MNKELFTRVLAALIEYEDAEANFWYGLGEDPGMNPTVIEIRKVIAEFKKMWTTE